jgi:Contractile injection system tube protein/LysM domain
MPVEKAFLEIERGQRIPCLFNPSQISVGRRNNWASEPMPGKGVSRLSYRGAQSGSMQVELVFDTTADGTAVTKHTGAILKLMDVDASLAGSDETTNNARPPFVIFHWGDLHSFKAVITDLQLVFTYFSASGIPLRAKMGLTMQQYEESQAFGPQNPTSGTPRPHRVHRVQPGETLDRIAARYYGDSTRWRSLAAANSIEDPLAMRPGALLSVPRIEHA